MADVLRSVPLTRVPPAGHYGAAGCGVRIRVVNGLSLASISAAKGCTNALIEACSKTYGMTLIDGPRVSGSDDSLSFVGLGPGRWLAVADDTGSLLQSLATALSTNAAVCDQTDGYVVLALEGSAVQACLAKGPAVDFDPATFGPCHVATTSTGHIGITIWRVGDTGAYRAAVARSFAPGFIRMLLSNAAEFGVEFA